MKLAKVLPVAALLLLSSTAWAQDDSQAEGGEAAELEALRAGLEDGLALAAEQLSGGDCGAACDALASMERSAERICELDPGPPCEAARREVDGARERVNAACPDCVTAGDENEVRAAQPGAVTREEQLDAEPMSAPPAADAKGGGCAACEVGGVDAPVDDAAWALLAGAALFAARRRRRRR